jgi:hypothetical protein
MACLLQGNWQTALAIHAFAPIFLVGMIIMLAVSVLPRPLHDKTVDTIAEWERRTGITQIILIGLVAYWVIRLIRFMQ